MTQVSLREAIERYGSNSAIAGTGAIEKNGRVGEVRVGEGDHGERGVLVEDERDVGPFMSLSNELVELE